MEPIDEEPFDLTQRSALERDFRGAIVSAIDAHGPITRANANSAAKRVIGALRVHNRRLATGTDRRRPKDDA